MTLNLAIQRLEHSSQYPLSIIFFPESQRKWLVPPIKHVMHLGTVPIEVEVQIAWLTHGIPIVQGAYNFGFHTWPLDTIPVQKTAADWRTTHCL